jgi:TetR/AcrR family transcriptional regulator, transcriptional repressor for nem operon
MRFEKGHKESTHKRIVDVASKRFRKDGVAASGLAGIMTEAGLTNGAFYSHFDSKESLVREALSSALSGQLAEFENSGDVNRDIESAIRRYLNRAHLEGYEEGCPSAALLPEIGRQPTLTKKTYEEGLLGYVNELASHLPNPGTAESVKRATSIFGLMVGTIQIARAVADPLLADQILEQGVQAALSLAKN